MESQVQYRPADVLWPERTSDPDIRYSFRLPGTDLWKPGNITTGRGLIESVARKVAGLADDAKYRGCIAETKRRQIAEFTGSQDRTFAHADELKYQRHRVERVNAELEKSSIATNDDQLHRHGEEHRSRRKSVKSLVAAGYAHAREERIPRTVVASYQSRHVQGMVVPLL